MTRPTVPGLARARIGAASLVGALVAVGAVMTIDSADASVWRELGLAVLSGGIVGGALVVVESLMSRGAQAIAEFNGLMTQLSTTIDLSGIDLRGQDLREIYLPGRAIVAGHFERGRLDDSKLYFGDFRHATFAQASLCRADFSGSTLAYANLAGADLHDAVLRDADLSHARLDSADLRGVNLTGGRLVGASLAGARLDGAVLTNCYLQGVDFTGASLRGTVLEGNEYDETTRWPAEFVPVPSVPVTQAAIAEMKLDSYLAWRATQPQ